MYSPRAWLGWASRFTARAPDVFRNAEGMAAVAAIAGCSLAVVAALRRQSGAPSTAHGSSRWATTDEITNAGLLRESGVVLCQTNEAEFRTRVAPNGKAVTSVRRLGSLVRHDGPEHVFCFAPTRSGKGVGLVIPTLLSWTQSVLVYDIKKENWALTAGWRMKFSRVWRFEPTAPDSVRFNQLMEIRRGDQRGQGHPERGRHPGRPDRREGQQGPLVRISRDGDHPFRRIVTTRFAPSCPSIPPS